MSTKLECKKVIKTFGGNAGTSSVRAVDGVSLTFESGVHMIVGKSGCGKSTLLHMLAGLEEPTSGNIFYGDYDIYNDRSVKYLKEKIRRKHFGFIYQSFNLIAELNVKDNIMMPVYLNGEKKSDRFDELVEILDIGNRINAMPQTLSGGEQQRAAIARAVINGPDILFADEPTGNLDEENGNAVMQLLLDVQKKYNATLIMVTHNLELLELADFVYEMSDGQIVDTQVRIA